MKYHGFNVIAVYYFEIKRYNMMNAFVYLIEFTAKIYFADLYRMYVQNILSFKEDAEECHPNGINYIQIRKEFLYHVMISRFALYYTKLLKKTTILFIFLLLVDSKPSTACANIANDANNASFSEKTTAE